jgi:hypothetical protein
MKTFSTITMGATAALLFAGAAAAADAKLSDAQSVYQKERAACLSGESVGGIFRELSRPVPPQAN